MRPKRSPLVRFLRAFSAVFVAYLVLGLAFAAFTGGLRIRTPMLAMTTALDELTFPDASVIATERRDEHLCFLQCEEWAVTRSFGLASRSQDGSDTDRLCAELEVIVEAWAGAESSGGVAESDDARRYYDCAFRIRRFRGNERWCADVMLLPAEGDPWSSGADVRAVLGIVC